MTSTAIELMRELPRPLRPQAAPGTWESALRQLPASGTVLSAGAGRGGLSWLLHRAGYSVVSVDLHPEHFIAEDLRCEHADFTKPLPFADETFDAVLAVEVAEHLENPWAFLREAVRVLRPDGILIFTSPNVVSLASRMHYLFTGVLPYFREESFVGCYHVTPLFPWAVERWTRTAGARVSGIAYSRVGWPNAKDIPDHTTGIRRRLKNLLPLNSLTGEITCYAIAKGGAPQVRIGVHYR